MEKRIGLAEREGVFEESYDLARPGPDGPAIPDELLALLYIILLDDENLEALLSSKSALPGRSKLTTDLIGHVLLVLLERRGKDYATTFEEDKKLLQGAQLSHRVTMAVNVRIGEKTVLREAMQEASKFEGSNKRLRTVATSGTGKRKAEGASESKKRGRFT